MENSQVDILLVEDREEDAELAMMALKENNLANVIKWVKDGQEALDFLFGSGEYEGRDVILRPKLVLLDLKMPKVDGIEVLKSIRDNKITRTLPVVVMTTSQEESDVVQAYNLNVNSYIIKPVGFKKFTNSVKDVGMYWLLLNQPPTN